MPSGGPRQGQVGQHYPNRSDMAGQPVQTAKGQTYGQAGQQAKAQSVIPIAAAPSAPPSLRNTPNGQVIPPGSIPSLSDPSAYPNEPVTAGLPDSPGVGPDALATPGSAMGPMELQIARQMYGVYKHPSLLNLIRYMEGSL